MKIYEYRGAMLHAKTATIDGVWASIGSINMDSRSFGLNHEACLVVYDAGIARRLEEIYRDDLRFAKGVTLDDWRRRSIGLFLELFFLPVRNQL